MGEATLGLNEPMTMTVETTLNRYMMVLLFDLAPRPGLVPLQAELDDDNLRAMFGVLA
jgi:hypothetical protein